MRKACCTNSVSVSTQMSGAAITLNEATEPANIIASKPSSPAILAEMPSYTDAGKMQRLPSTIARSRSRRSVQFIRAPLSLLNVPKTVPF